MSERDELLAQFAEIKEAYKTPPTVVLPKATNPMEKAIVQSIKEIQDKFTDFYYTKGQTLIELIDLLLDDQNLNALKGDEPIKTEQNQF